jgi:hypothetical protein
MQGVGDTVIWFGENLLASSEVVVVGEVKVGEVVGVGALKQIGFSGRPKSHPAEQIDEFPAISGLGGA